MTASKDKIEQLRKLGLLSEEAYVKSIKDLDILMNDISNKQNNELVANKNNIEWLYNNNKKLIFSLLP